MSRDVTIQASELLHALVNSVSDGPAAQQQQHQQQSHSFMSNNHTSLGSAGGGGSLTTLLGWRLDAPRGQACEFNVVTLYKQHSFVPTAAEQQNGWDACRRLKDLKRIIASDGKGTLEVLVEYAALLSSARQFVATNEWPFLYDNLPEFTRCHELDFELYMTLSYLAAVDVQHAQQARSLDTINGLVDAADMYERAGWFLMQAYTELFATLPPPDRVRHVPEVPWIMLFAPQGASRAAANEVLRARAELMRAEAALCRRRALERELDAEADSELRTLVLNGTAEYCARQFLSITHALATYDGGRTRMARYAAVTACRLRLELAARLAEADLVLAERDKDANALARALRRLDHSVLPSCTTDQRAAVSSDILAALDRVLAAVVALRTRADQLRMDATGVFHLLDLASAVTQPAAPNALDPASIDDTERPELNPAMEVVVRMREHLARAHQRFTAFFALRASYLHALQQLSAYSHTSNASSAHNATSNGLGGTEGAEREPSVYSDFDVLFQRALQQLGQLPGARRAHLASDVETFVELMRAMHALGALGERARWLDFTFAADDATNPDTGLVRNVDELQQARLNAANYLALLTTGVGAKQ